LLQPRSRAVKTKLAKVRVKAVAATKCFDLMVNTT
jgi:hypothetical protein